MTVRPRPCPWPAGHPALLLAFTNRSSLRARRAWGLGGPGTAPPAGGPRLGGGTWSRPHGEEREHRAVGAPSWRVTLGGEVREGFLEEVLAWLRLTG